MKKLLIVLTLVFAMVVCSSMTVLAAETLYFEAESIQLNTMTVTDNADAFGGKAITSTEAEQDAVLKFSVKEGGKYVFWFRVNCPGGEGNSWFLSMDGDNKRWIFDALETDADYNIWYWIKGNFRDDAGVRMNALEYDLAAGDHELLIQVREAKGMIDEIIVTNDLAFDPTDVVTSHPAPAPEPAAASASKTGDVGMATAVIAALSSALVIFRKRK